MNFHLKNNALVGRIKLSVGSQHCLVQSTLIAFLYFSEKNKIQLIWLKYIKARNTQTWRHSAWLNVSNKATVGILECYHLCRICFLCSSFLWDRMCQSSVFSNSLNHKLEMLFSLWCLTIWKCQCGLMSHRQNMGQGKLTVHSQGMVSLSFLKLPPTHTFWL